MERIRVLLKHKQGSEEKIKTEKLLALSTMIDGLAHEVRNPVTAIGGMPRILAHGGTISARSTPGFGTEVVIECPIAEPGDSGDTVVQ